MRRIIAALCTLLSLTLLSSVASAQEAAADINVGPWVTNVGEDGFNVLWTSSFRTLSWVEVAPDDGSDFDSMERPVFYQVISGRRVIDTFHDVRVSGLKPGVKYRYRIMSMAVLDDESAYGTKYGPAVMLPVPGESAVRTLDSGAEKCRFALLNDMHAIDEKYRSLTAGLSSENIDFLVLNGDMMSYINDVDDMARHVFGPVPELVSSVPLYYTRGNHETRGRQAFMFQEYNPTSTGDTYFMLRHGPLALLFLDAGEDKPDDSKEYSGAVDFDLFRRQQLEWLKKAVKDPVFRKAPVKVAVMHIPAFNNEGSWYGEKKANEMLVPVLNEAGVDIMLSAHYHRHVFADKGEYGNAFPILVNDNMCRIDFEAQGRSFTINIYDTEGKLVRSYAGRGREVVPVEN